MSSVDYMNQFSLMTCLLPGVSYFEDPVFTVHTMNIHTRCYPKVPEMYQKKKAETLKVLIATVPFKVVPLGVYTTNPTFLPRSEAVLEVLLCQRVQYLLRFGLDLFYGVKSSPFQLDFHLGEEGEVTGGYIRRVGGMGDDRHGFGGQKMLHSQSSVRGCIVMMEHPVVWPLPPHVLPKPPQDVVVELHFDSLTWRQEFLMDNPINIEKGRPERSSSSTDVWQFLNR
jgi:hypothetical protein